MSYIRLLLLVIFCIFPFSVNSENKPDQLVNKISKNIRCLICQGQSVYDSQSEFSTSIRIVIKKKISENYSEDEIYKYLKDQYGEWIVYDPEFNKNTIFLWLLPLLIFALGGLIILRKIRIFK